MLTTRSNYKTLDTYGTLLRQSRYNGSPRAASRLARGVLIAIGIALCSAAPAGQATTSQQITPFRYATFLVGEVQAECLFRIAIKESNIRYNAINRSSGATGAWQFMETNMLTKTPMQQVELAIKYAEHRYGSACDAWAYWKVNKWW